MLIEKYKQRYIEGFFLVYQVAFEAVKGSGYKSDIAIDDISMTACGEY
jgi:hypothetical protein